MLKLHLIAYTAAQFTWAAVGMAQQAFDLDVTFRATIQERYISSMTLMDDGKVLVSGEFNFPGGPTQYLARLNEDGSRDDTFAIVVAGGGKIVPWADRYYVATGPAPKRLTPTGTLDNSFSLSNPSGFFDYVQGGDYLVYPNGSVIVTGQYILQVPDSGWTGTNYCMIWFNNDGTLDLTRQPRKGNGPIYLIVPQPDGKFLLSGAATSWEGVPKPNIFRVHADGTLDTGFNCAMGWGEAASMTVLEDGRILVSGLFKTEFSSPDSLHFVRLMPDGSLDPTFNNDLEVVRMPWLQSEWPGNTINWGQFALPNHKRLSDGNIVLHGSHYVIDGEERRGMAMLDSDGNLLPESFAAGGCGRYVPTGFNFLYGDIYGLLEAPDGHIYIWGAYHGYDDGTTNDTQQRMVSRLYGLNVGVREQEETRIRVYPNPASSTATVEMERVPHAATLVLRDALGREVLRQQLKDHYTTLQLQALSDGLYTLQLLVGNTQVVNRKLVVQK